MLPRIEVLKVIGAPYRELLTDYYWVQTLQAVTRANTPEEYRDLYDYGELVSELDPKFRPIYLFVGGALPVHLGDGNWENTAESTKILEKGHARFPDQVLLAILLAYNLSEHHKETQRAATVLLEVSKVPGAPRWLPLLATRMLAEAKDFDAGLALAQSLARSDDPETRATFQRRVKELELERLLTEVDSASAAYLSRTGRAPETVAALVEAGDLPSLPVDPLGGQIVLGENRKARSTAALKRLKLLGRDAAEEVR
ncbi:MAG: hypothetical protein HYZ28_01675 [Myxococcales bacterium]|nr:hypothetical protein [Myxococcales bacterium]